MRSDKDEVSRDSANRASFDGSLVNYRRLMSAASMERGSASSDFLTQIATPLLFTYLACSTYILSFI